MNATFRLSRVSALCLMLLLAPPRGLADDAPVSGIFDGASGVLTTCVGLYDGSGALLVNPQGRAEIYAVSLNLGERGPQDDYIFRLSSAVYSDADSCSGIYQDQVYRDSVLIENAGNLSGKVLSTWMDLISEKDFSFRLDIGKDRLLELRDFAANGVALGSDLGSFSSDSSLSYNSLALPAAYPLTAPACEDPEGDAGSVIVEIDGWAVLSVAPGAIFELPNLAPGGHQIRAYCRDLPVLPEARVENYAASSPYASGSLSIEVEYAPGCGQPIAAVMEDLGNNFPGNLPTWEDLECYAAGLARQAEPGFLLTAGDSPPEENYEGPHPPFWSEVQDRLAFAASWPEANMYDFVLGEVPPYLMGVDDDYTEEGWDQKLRSMATYGIYLKSLGLRIKTDFFYPPSNQAHFVETASASEFLAWWEQVYIPERVRLAQVAELIHAESYQPWDVEPGQFVRAAGDAWLEDLSPEEQIALTQEIIDKLYTAVRPEFSGSLDLINYDRFQAVGDHWKNLDLSDWDRVHFILFTEGDLLATDLYLEDQIEGYAEMVVRDGIQSWVLALSVKEDSHQRLLDQLDQGESFEDIEADVYRRFFEAVDALPVPLDGIGVTTGQIVSAEAEAVVRENFLRLGK